MRRLVARSTIVLGAAVLAGCSFSFSTGGGGTIEADEIEGEISSEMTKQHPDLPVTSVTCPDGVKPAQGVTFECTAQLEGAQLPVEVTITQVDVGEGTFSYDMKPTKTILILEEIVKSMKAALRDQDVRDVDIDCGTGPYRVVEIGGAIECTVSAGEERRVVRVVDDVDGGVRFEEG